MRKVYFQKGNGKYVKGDVALLSDAEAQEAVESRRAIYLDASNEENVMSAVPNLPKQEKIPNLCAICGDEFQAPEELAEHKEKEHGIS